MSIYLFRPAFSSWSGADGSGGYRVYCRPGIAEPIERVRREPGAVVRDLEGLRGLAPGRVVVSWHRYHFDSRGGAFDSFPHGELALEFDGTTWAEAAIKFGPRMEGRADEGRRNAIRAWVGLPQVVWGCLADPQDVSAARERLERAAGEAPPEWARALLAGDGANAKARMGYDWRVEPTEAQRAGIALAELLNRQGWVTRVA